MAELLKEIRLEGDYLLRIPGWTEERYFKEAPENRFVEFEDGELIMHSPVNIRHQRLAAFLSFLLIGYVRANKLGEVLTGPAVVRLRPNLNYEPDIFYVAHEQSERFAEEYFSGAPKMIVEILSPGTRNHDLKTKAAAYREHGVQEYWVLDPKRQRVFRHLLPENRLEPYTVTEEIRGKLQSEAIPGFWVKIDWLWSDPLPPEPDCLAEILAS